MYVYIHTLRSYCCLLGSYGSSLISPAEPPTCKPALLKGARVRSETAPRGPPFTVLLGPSVGSTGYNTGLGLLLRGYYKDSFKGCTGV